MTGLLSDAIMIRRFFGQHPILSTVTCVPLPFPLLFFAGLILLMLLDAVLIPFGLEAGFVYRLFLAPTSGFAAAMFGCGYLVLYSHEPSKELRLHRQTLLSL